MIRSTYDCARSFDLEDARRRTEEQKASQIPANTARTRIDDVSNTVADSGQKPAARKIR